MNKIKVAIYGHYDSRGGAVAIELSSDANEAELRESMKYYDTEVMCHDSEAEYDPPSVEDFIHVAEIHFEGELPEDDLIRGYSETGGEILREWNEEDEQEQARREMSKEERDAEDQKRSESCREFRDKWERDPEAAELEQRRILRLECEKRIQETLANPVQLEFITVGPEVAELEAKIEKAATTRYKFPIWDRTAAEEAERAKLEAEIAEMNQQIETLFKQQAKVTRNPVLANYGEDACGLVLIRL